MLTAGQAQYPISVRDTLEWMGRLVVLPEAKILTTGSCKGLTNRFKCQAKRPKFRTTANTGVSLTPF